MEPLWVSQARYLRALADRAEKGKLTVRDELAIDALECVLEDPPVFAELTVAERLYGLRVAENMVLTERVRVLKEILRAAGVSPAMARGLQLMTSMSPEDFDELLKPCSDDAEDVIRKLIG